MEGAGKGRILLSSEVTLFVSRILSPIVAISNTLLEALLFYCWFARDVKAALLVCRE